MIIVHRPVETFLSQAAPEQVVSRLVASELFEGSSDYPKFESFCKTSYSTTTLIYCNNFSKASLLLEHLHTIAYLTHFCFLDVQIDENNQYIKAVLAFLSEFSKQQIPIDLLFGNNINSAYLTETSNLTRAAIVDYSQDCLYSSIFYKTIEIFKAGTDFCFSSLQRIFNELDATTLLLKCSVPQPNEPATENFAGFKGEYNDTEFGKQYEEKPQKFIRATIIFSKKADISTLKVYLGDQEASNELLEFLVRAEITDIIEYQISKYYDELGLKGSDFLLAEERLVCSKRVFVSAEMGNELLKVNEQQLGDLDNSLPILNELYVRNSGEVLHFSLKPDFELIGYL